MADKKHDWQNAQQGGSTGCSGKLIAHEVKAFITDLVGDWIQAIKGIRLVNRYPGDSGQAHGLVPARARV